MSDDKKIVGDDDLNAGGGEETVKRETYNRVLKQRKADQELNESLKQKLAAFEAKENEAEEKKLMENQNWAEAIELKNRAIADRDSQISELSGTVDHLNKTFDEATRLDAVMQKFPGRLKKKGYMNFIDTSKLIVDPETGALDDASVVEVANEFMKDYSELIDTKTGKTPPADNPNSASSSTLTIEQWKKLPLKEKKERMAEVYKANT